MDEKKNTQNTSSTKTPVTINAMSKMMAMQASLPELIFNLKLMGVNVGGSIINPFIAMTFVQAIETAVEKTGNDAHERQQRHRSYDAHDDEQQGWKN